MATKHSLGVEPSQVLNLDIDQVPQALDSGVRQVRVGHNSGRREMPFADSETAVDSFFGRPAN
jgi:hypothetical protein